MALRLGFLHTAAVHVATFDGVVAEADGGVETVHCVDEDLLRIARSVGADHRDVGIAVDATLARLADKGVGVIVCTCSTIGGVAESAVGVDIPVLRVDRPMAAVAVERAARIAVVAALESTLEPTLVLLRNECERQHRWPELALTPCLDAWDFWESGNVDGYHRALAEHVDGLEDTYDVIVLAQASMLGALPLISDRPDRLVLASPTSAVEAALRRLRDR